MSVNNAMTADFLRSAYGGESMAQMRYFTWADVADREKMPNIGRLFRAIAYAEYVHANNHFRELKDEKGDSTVTSGAIFGIGDTVENLQGGIDGELHEIEQMYPVYLEAARFQGEKGAERTFHYALEAEKAHLVLFQRAQDIAKEGKDMDIDLIHVCNVCGHTTVDGLPDQCPICSAKKAAYKTFSE